MTVFYISLIKLLEFYFLLVRVRIKYRTKHMDYADEFIWQ
jgi:hypothetical protein